MPEDRRLRSTCSAKLEALRWTSNDWFEIAGARFGVRTTSVSFGAWVRYVLAAYRAEGPLDPGDVPSFSLVIEDPESPSGRATRNLHILYRGTFAVVRSLDVSVVARTFLGEIGSITFPGRDDAIYLGASVIGGPDTTVLIPTRFVPAIGVAGRRIQRALDIRLPAQLTVALDRESGHLIPAPGTLDIPADALDILARSVPSVANGDRRSFVEREVAVDRVVVWGRERGLHPTSKGPVLFDLARSIRNLGVVGKQGVMTLARVLSEAEVLSMSWWGTSNLIEVLGQAVGSERYVSSRTELTSVGS